MLQKTYIFYVCKIVSSFFSLSLSQLQYKQYKNRFPKCVVSKRNKCISNEWKRNEKWNMKKKKTKQTNQPFKVCSITIINTINRYVSIFYFLFRMNNLKRSHENHFNFVVSTFEPTIQSHIYLLFYLICSEAGFTFNEHLNRELCNIVNKYW